MTKTCVVCKKYPISGDNTRSFHKFPFNEDVKKQWMDVTGICELKVNCTVCSDHFTPQSYHPSDGLGRKRLLRNAVPIVEKKVIKKEENSDGNSEDETEEGRARLSRANDPFSNCDGQSCSGDSADDSMDMDSMTRKSSIPNLTPFDMKRMYRFRDGDETKYISRDEFVTENAWNKFLRLMHLNRRRLEGRRYRIGRRKKLAASGKQIKEETQTQQEDECEPEQFLEVVLEE